MDLIDWGLRHFQSNETRDGTVTPGAAYSVSRVHGRGMFNLDYPHVHRRFPIRLRIPGKLLKWIVRGGGNPLNRNQSHARFTRKRPTCPIPKPGSLALALVMSLVLAGSVCGETAGYWSFETNLNDESTDNYQAYVKLNSLGSGVSDQQYMVLEKSDAHADAKANDAFLPSEGDMSSRKSRSNESRERGSVVHVEDCLGEGLADQGEGFRATEIMVASIGIG